MEEKKFEEIMDNWASKETESAPQLRPTKEMYQMVKAKKQRVLFPVFARWATVGIAAATIVLVASLYPDVFRLWTYFEQSPQKEATTVKSQKEGEVDKGLPAPDREKMAEPDIPGTTFEESATLSDEEAKAVPEEIPVSVMQSSEKAEKPRAEIQIEKESGVHKKRDLGTRKSPLPSPSLGETSDSTVGRTIQPPAPTEVVAKSKTTSEPLKVKLTPDRSVTLPGAEEESASDTLSFRSRVAAPESSVSGKDKVAEKQVDTKIFRVKDGVWIDTEHSQEKKIFKIKRDSQVYHDLISVMPQLKPYFEISRNVIVNIGKYSIEIADDGKTELAEDELKKLIQE